MPLGVRRFSKEEFFPPTVLTPQCRWERTPTILFSLSGIFFLPFFAPFFYSHSSPLSRIAKAPFSFTLIFRYHSCAASCRSHPEPFFHPSTSPRPLFFLLLSEFLPYELQGFFDLGGFQTSLFRPNQKSFPFPTLFFSRLIASFP